MVRDGRGQTSPIGREAADIDGANRATRSRASTGVSALVDLRPVVRDIEQTVEGGGVGGRISTIHPSPYGSVLISSGAVSRSRFARDRAGDRRVQVAHALGRLHLADRSARLTSAADLGQVT